MTSPRLNRDYKSQLRDVIVREYVRTHRPLIGWHMLLPIIISVLMVLMLRFRLGHIEPVQSNNPHFFPTLFQFK